MSLKLQKHGAMHLVLPAISILLTLAFLAAALPQAALAAANAQTCAQNHTVVAGDTLSGLSVQYNISQEEIIAANSLQEPYTLTIGQQLCIPVSTTTTDSTGATGTTPTSTTSTITNTTSTGPALALSFNGSFLNVAVTKFASKGSFIVKVGEGRVLDNDWIKVGRMKTDKDGRGSRSFKLPKDLREVEFITVCAKNATNDEVECSRLNLDSTTALPLNSTPTITSTAEPTAEPQPTQTPEPTSTP